MNLDDVRPQLKRLFLKHEVRLAYLFGSQASGRIHPESDVDIAVLLGESLTADDRFAIRMALGGELSVLFRTDRVDMVILNEASPLLAYEVLRNGRLLHCPHEEDRIRFQVRTLLAYEDTAPLRRILTEALAERVKAGRFGKPVPIQRG